jgi:hypothetical protein
VTALRPPRRPSVKDVSEGHGKGAPGVDASFGRHTPAAGGWQFRRQRCHSLVQRPFTPGCCGQPHSGVARPRTASGRTRIPDYRSRRDALEKYAVRFNQSAKVGPDFLTQNAAVTVPRCRTRGSSVPRPINGGGRASREGLGPRAPARAGRGGGVEAVPGVGRPRTGSCGSRRTSLQRARSYI